MKIVTVGRLPENTEVVNDPYVARRHLEMIQDDSGNFILRDLDTINGTYVNGKKIKGQIYLNPTDIIRIGNTTLPWRSYFIETTVNTTTISGNNGKEKESFLKKIMTFNLRNFLSIIMTIVSLILMIVMLLKHLKHVG